MNIGSKKALLRASNTIYILTISIYFSLFATAMRLAPFIISYNIEYKNKDLSNIYYILIPIIFTLITLITAFAIILFSKKQKQQKEQFYKHWYLVKFISITTLFFNPILAIIQLCFLFRQDDGKEEQPLYFRHPKKQKTNYDKETKKQIKELKTQKRKGLISNYNYDKQYKKIEHSFLNKQKNKD